MEYDINRPWLTLDPWQDEYINKTEPNQNCFLLTGRQSGKTAGMSIRAVELCMKHFKKGDYILINSITEKQAYHMLAKCLAYAKEKYQKYIKTGKDRPTMHKLMFKNGTGILCYAAGESGEGLRGLTIKKLMCDEGSRMSEEYFIAIIPSLSVSKGSIDIASTPFGKFHSDGTKKFFYKCSMDESFKKFYVSAEDCPRHDSEFLKQQKERMTKLAYAQEYLAQFTDELKRLFPDELLKRCCRLQRSNSFVRGRYYLGVDVAGFGKDECTYEIFKRNDDKTLIHIDSIIEKRNFTTDTSNRIKILNRYYNFLEIGIDDAGVGFGVYSELMNEFDTKRKIKPLNNASREVLYDGTRSKKLLKEEMYFNLLRLMETDKILLLDDDEVLASLSSMQLDEGKIFGSYSHVSEGIVRAVWLASNPKNLNIFARTF